MTYRHIETHRDIQTQWSWLWGTNHCMLCLRQTDTGLWSGGRGFNSRSGHYQVVSTWMGDCLWTGKPSQYI